MDRALPPWALRERVGEIGVVGAVKNAASDNGHALDGEDDQPGQIVPEMSKLAPVVKQVEEDPCVVGNHGHRCNNWHFHHRPLVLVSVFSLDQE